MKEISGQNLASVMLLNSSPSINSVLAQCGSSKSDPQKTIDLQLNKPPKKKFKKTMLLNAFDSTIGPISLKK
jgi:hypothetical protein